ncbi:MULTISPECIES: hypothetical protein [Agrobacterium]|uniref:CD-NTase associated protein 4-like DNA endonuclease domain-containing protein n=1 Tax=Agrobacterium tumefaciens TaxID=358 RepID=A0AAF0GXK0_AGRTU|nr:MULTISPECIES: hypothetical protein [Agrobacterium]WGM58356.1 hypothetical protein CFBP5506_08370 [Agrobacterium tumefaciens]CVI61382.1 conserved hypothetical protein [Agrobacterium salinitolerans str. Hayward 0363]
MSDRSRVDTTSAEDKSIGFDYQYYYFLNELLNIKSGQVVGLEVLDDVHIELSDGTQLLVQLKHTVQTNAAGLPKNLTTTDGDLWKSLSNWAKVISDPAEARGDVPAQLIFLKKTSFVLASNKSESQTNAILSSIAAFKAGDKDHAGLVADMATIKLGSADSTIQGYITDVLALDPSVSEKFFERLSFSLGLDAIIARCKTSIAEKQIEVTRIDDVFRDVDSELRSDVFQTVKARQKITISFDEFNRRYRRFFDRVRSERLVIRKFPAAMPSELLDQTFIRQLLDINDISQERIDFLTKFTTKRLQFRNNVDQWTQDGDITQSDIDDLEEEAQALWESKFLAAYPNEHATADERASARGIVADLRQKKLSLASVELPIPISNGGFYDLSDRPVIGWLSDWKDRYN